MNRNEAISHPNCPQWLKDADWEGDVSIEPNGFVTFHKGNNKPNHQAEIKICVKKVRW